MYLLKMVTENASSKTLDILENSVLLYSCGWMKTEVFKKNYVTGLDTSNAHAPIKDGTIFSNHYVFV